MGSSGCILWSRKTRGLCGRTAADSWWRSAVVLIDHRWSFLITVRGGVDFRVHDSASSAVVTRDKAAL
jgi:hypothetical protein